MNDNSPDAYEKLVDKLLACKQFGERQALFWLDLVRFAETDGFKADDAAAARVALPRLRHQEFQCRQAIRQVRERADCGRRTLPRRPGRNCRHRFPATLPGRIQRGESRTAPLRNHHRHHRHHRGSLPRAHGRLRPLSRPQVRPDPAARLLPHASLLRRVLANGGAADHALGAGRIREEAGGLELENGRAPCRDGEDRRTAPQEGHREGTQPLPRGIRQPPRHPVRKTHSPREADRRDGGETGLRPGRWLEEPEREGEKGVRRAARRSSRNWRRRNPPNRREPWR